MLNSSTLSSHSSTPSTSASTSSTSERNKALLLCLGILLPVFLFVTIVLCCKFSCGKQRKKTLEKERIEDEQLAREEQALRREGIISTEDEWSSDSEEVESRASSKRQLFPEK
ncbi:uncharacterized protein JCM6883_002370 [Sporobolomyces salmoneus]|uniref:uncharacterized protein n=1 Tax=Sporobolomyces salmoneus TaxID=183962 RepID=UPI00316BA6B6